MMEISYNLAIMRREMELYFHFHHVQRNFLLTQKTLREINFSYSHPQDSSLKTITFLTQLQSDRIWKKK
jgi:hypothetical protein